MNEIKIDKTPFKNILICYIGYVMVKDLRYIKINSVNPLYLPLSSISGFFKKINGNKYLTLVRNDESKEMVKNMKNYGAK